MSTPLFSVIITTFNRPELIKVAIRSVLDQIEKSYELIIINDGSNADYHEISDFCQKHENIKYYYKNNEERSVARNFGIQKSVGRYVCFLDDDDYYLKNHLYILKNSINKNPQIEFYFTSSFKRKGNILTKKELIGEYKNKNELLKKIMAKHIWSCNACIKKELLNIHNFNSNLNLWEDENLYLKLCARYKALEIPIYSTVVVDHSARGTTETFNSYDIIQTEPFINAVNDLYSDKVFSNHVSKAEKTYFLFEKIQTFLLNAYWRNNHSAVFSYYRKLILLAPLKTLTNKTLINIIGRSVILRLLKITNKTKMQKDIQ